jgi:hypothetical protein
MTERDPAEPLSEASPDAKRAFFGKLDAKLAAAGYAVNPPAPAPPALTFEAWAELSVRFDGSRPEDLTGALSARGVTLEVWKRFDAEYRRALSDDLRAGKQERPAIYDGKYKQEQARRAGTPAPPIPAALPTPQIAPASLRGTTDSPELVAAVFEAVSRMPFVPPPPEPAGQGKRAPKTVQSKAVQSGSGGQTMSLDAGALQRPTPTLPFSGGTGGEGVLYVPRLDARQYVSLLVELWLNPASREDALRRYQVPNEAAFRAVEEHWRNSGRRAELEATLVEFGLALRGRVLP